MTTEQTARIPYCHKIRYGISGAPILTEDEMDGSHAPGVGVDPTLIELIYSAARDGKPASISASVTGWWMRYGKRDEPEDQVTVHFTGGPDGWPAWLAEEARLHDPAASSVPPPPPATRADVLQEAADFFRGLSLTGTAITAREAEAELLRMADEEQPAKAARCPHGCDTSTCPCLACEADNDVAQQQPSGEDVVEAYRLALSEALHLGNGAPWDAILDRAADLSRRDVEALRRLAAEAHAVPLATTCAYCGHRFDEHNRFGCCVGNEEVRCGCDAFVMGEKPAPVDPRTILGIEADVPAPVAQQPAAADGEEPQQ